jgi:hypothetical protein
MSEMCSICHQSNGLLTHITHKKNIKCSLVVHQECINEWLKQGKKICPQCNDTMTLETINETNYSYGCCNCWKLFRSYFRHRYSVIMPIYIFFNLIYPFVLIFSVRSIYGFRSPCHWDYDKQFYWCDHATNQYNVVMTMFGIILNIFTSYVCPLCLTEINNNVDVNDYYHTIKLVSYYVLSKTMLLIIYFVTREDGYRTMWNDDYSFLLTFSGAFNFFDIFIVPIIATLCYFIKWCSRNCGCIQKNIIKIEQVATSNKLTI